ncbi:unnamed protein product [Prorocentrum cordatum]|uniref:Protochlorophyllide reductase n=1 Tax=Prorocentrum cordatum TaxID=2364126 RepID=A0ABN9XK43_9DINO|nr:unnamed protein product [Polarella glacialis]
MHADPSAVCVARCAMEQAHVWAWPEARVPCGARLGVRDRPSVAAGPLVPRCLLGVCSWRTQPVALAQAAWLQRGWARCLHPPLCCRPGPGAPLGAAMSPPCLKCDPKLFEKDLTGQVVIVTGGNQGIGYVTARQLASQGAKVVLACRSKERGERAAGEVKAAFMPLELSSQASVRSFASAFLEKYGRLDILVNNAGVMACPLERTEEGYEMQLATNHLGHFLLTVLLKSVLEQCKGRVVALSSAAASQMSMGTMPFGHADIHWDDIHAVRQDQVHPISGVRPVEALQRPHVPGDPEALLWSAGGKCSPWLDGHRAHEAHRELMPAVPAPLLLEEEGRRWRLARSGGGRPDDTALRPVVPRGPRERGVLLAKGHLHGQGGAGRWVANAAAQPERHGAVSRQAVGREPAIVRARSLDLELLERAAALERALPRTPLPPFRLQTRSAQFCEFSPRFSRHCASAAFSSSPFAVMSWCVISFAALAVRAERHAPANSRGHQSRPLRLHAARRVALQKCE